MEYRGYTIKAEVQTYETWTLDPVTGYLDEYDGNNGIAEITGYFFYNPVLEDDFFQAMERSSPEELKEYLDAHIAEQQA